MQNDSGSRFIIANFEPADRLAIVLIDRQTGAVVQRIALAERIASSDFQAWLNRENNSGRDVFVSMNALAQQARGRTRTEVETIRHVYLDFDENGTKAVKQMRKDGGMPEPTCLVSTSPDHWQVSWRVRGFGKAQAEELMRGMVLEFGADPAATDCARVMRIPGFVSHKRSGYLVGMEQLSTAIYSPDHFPRFEQNDRPSPRAESPLGSTRVSKQRRQSLSQSEYDWAYAKRALARGEPQEAVVAAIAAYRCGDKHDVEYYARMTVEKAARALTDPPLPSGYSSPDR